MINLMGIAMLLASMLHDEASWTPRQISLWDNKVNIILSSSFLVHNQQLICIFVLNISETGRSYLL